jgi:hypothetical protein
VPPRTRARANTPLLLRYQRTAGKVGRVGSASDTDAHPGRSQESVWLCHRCVWLLTDLGAGLSLGVLGLFSGLLVSVGLVQSFLEPSSQFAMGGTCLVHLGINKHLFTQQEPCLTAGEWLSNLGIYR